MSAPKTPNAPPRYKLIFFVPESSLDKCKSAVFGVGESQIANFHIPLLNPFVPTNSPNLQLT